MQAAVQAAGHPGAQQGHGLYVKPSSAREIAFYEALAAADSPLLAVVPEFMGTLRPGITPGAQAALAGEGGEGGAGPLLINDSTGSSAKPAAQPAADAQPMIVLFDELAPYTFPSVLDVKLGSELWDEFAAPEKVERLRAVRDSTTSGSLQLRIAGMTVVQPPEFTRKVYGKQFGRAIGPDGVVGALAEFFPSSDRLFDTVLENFIEQLGELREMLEENPAELHSVSVLLIYEGDAAALAARLAGEVSADSIGDEDDDSDGEEVKDGTWTVKLIDFAHARLADTPQQDVLAGLTNLVQKLRELADLRAPGAPKPK